MPFVTEAESKARREVISWEVMFMDEARRTMSLDQEEDWEGGSPSLVVVVVVVMKSLEA